MSRFTVIIAIQAVLLSWKPFIAMSLGEEVPKQAVAVSSKATQVVHDIRLKAGHCFRGQLPEDAFPKSKQSVWVRFFRDNRLIAETKTDRGGRFTLRYLPAGTGILVIAADGQAKACFCRLWAPGAAPSLKNCPGNGNTSVDVARAQSLHVFPTTSFQQVATTASVFGGAVATPVIWHNVQQDHKAPISGS